MISANIKVEDNIWMIIRNFNYLNQHLKCSRLAAFSLGERCNATDTS